MEHIKLRMKQVHKIVNYWLSWVLYRYEATPPSRGTSQYSTDWSLNSWYERWLLSTHKHDKLCMQYASTQRPCNYSTSNVTSVTESRSASAHLFASTWHPVVSVITTLYYVAIIFHCRVWYPVLSLRVFTKINKRMFVSSADRYIFVTVDK